MSRVPNGISNPVDAPIELIDTSTYYAVDLPTEPAISSPNDSPPTLLDYFALPPASEFPIALCSGTFSISCEGGCQRLDRNIQP